MDHASDSSPGNTVLIQLAPYSKVEMRVTYSDPDNTHICGQYLEPDCGTTTHYSWESPTEDEGEEKRRGSEDEGDQDVDADADDHHQDHHHLMKFIMEVSEKLPESVRNHLNLEELIALLRKKREKHHPKSKIKITTTSRGGKSAIEELFMKLEKFKVRTVTVDDTSTEDQEIKT